MIAWLEYQDHDYEPLTEEDIHLEGVDALKPYNVVLTGTHPKYISEEIPDAAEDYG